MECTARCGAPHHTAELGAELRNGLPSCAQSSAIISYSVSGKNIDTNNFSYSVSAVADKQ